MQAGMGAKRVHDSHRAGFFLKGILRRADLSTGIIKIGERNGRLKHLASGIGVEQERTEFITEPQRSVRRALYRLNVEVRASQHAIRGKMVRDSERNLVIRIMQFDKALNLDLSTAIVAGLEFRTDGVHSEIEISRVLQATEPIIAHHQKGAVAVVEHGGEPLHGLLFEGNFLAVDRAGTEELARDRAGGERGGREHGTSDQFIVSSAFSAVQDSGDGEADKQRFAPRPRVSGGSF